MNDARTEPDETSTEAPDLATWLLARIDAEEQRALAAGHGFGHRPIGHPLNGTWTQLDLSDNVRPTYDQAFLHDWRPARVAAECDAKRQLIGPHVPHRHRAAAGRCQDCYDSYPCLTLRLLALPYSDRDGYREEWKP